MKTNTHTEIMDISIYLETVESGILMNASERIDEIEQRITHSYSKIKTAAGRLERLGKEETNDLRDKIHISWMHLKAALTIARIRLELTEEKSEAKLQSAKDELIRDFEKIRDLAKDNTEEACKKSSKWIKGAKKSVGKRTHNVLKALKS